MLLEGQRALSEKVEHVTSGAVPLLYLFVGIEASISKKEEAKSEDNDYKTPHPVRKLLGNKLISVLLVLFPNSLEAQNPSNRLNCTGLGGAMKRLSRFT